MKISKILAGMSAMAIAGSVMAMAVSADDATEVKRKPLLSCTVEKSSGPSDNTWSINPLDIMSEADAAKVDKIEATVTAQAYTNGALGVNSAKADGWLAGKQQESGSAGTSIWTMEDVGGLKIDTDEDTGDKSGYVQFQIWWMNAQGDDDTGYTPATSTLDKVVFFDADGNALATVEGDVDDGLPVLGGVPYVYGDIEDNGKIRLEIFNAWGASNGDEKLAAAFAKLSAEKEVEVQFTLKGVPEGSYVAKMMFADGSWSWNTMDDKNPTPNTTATVTGDGTYSVKMTAAEGAAALSGTTVFCVDIEGLATALGIENPKDAAPALRQKLAMDAGLTVSDVKILVDGVEFDPTNVPDDSTESSESTPDSSESKAESSESTTDSTESTTNSTNSAATSSKAANNASNTNPSTGAAALAAVGVALAGAAVVATKKRK